MSPVSALVNKVGLLKVLLALVLITCCKQLNDCSRLPMDFATYQEAINSVKSASFKISETADATSSSWIGRAAYYSCDGYTGYFIIETEGRKYIHERVPRDVWNDFKNSESLGSYYNQKIKGRYKMDLKH